MANEFLSEIDTPDFLAALAAHAGGIEKLAAFCNVDSSNLGKAVRGKLKPPSALLDRLGIERAVFYVLPRNLAEWWEQRQSAAEGESQRDSDEP